MKSLPQTVDFQALYNELLMIPRSITGDGFKKSLEIISRYIPFEVEHYPSGSKVLDWNVPPELKFERAVLKDSKGNIILDSDVNPLHVLNYSVGFQGTVSREELESHLYTDSRNPDHIPYVTSYYKDRWGFCLSSKVKASLNDTHYEVDIRASKDPEGSVVIGVCDLPGQSDRIVLISSYLCHPSMLNNELSGPLSLIWMYLMLASLPASARRYTYRFIINPETIGSLCYLSRHAEELKEKLEYGMTVTCTGSFYSNDYAGKYNSISPVDLSLLNEHLSSETSENIALEKDMTCYNNLLYQIDHCTEQNFLPVPLTFKMTHQSLLDEFNHHVEQQALYGTTAQVPVPAPSAASGTALCAAAKPSMTHSMSHAPLATESQDMVEGCDLENAISKLSDMEREGHYVLNGAVNTGLSDRERVALTNWAVNSQIRIFSITKTINPDSVSVSPGVKLSSTVDRLIARLNCSAGSEFKHCVFMPFSGSDERQYGSALFNLPVVSAFRTVYCSYGEYHSSFDNQDLFSLDSVIHAAVQLVKFTRFYERRDEKIKALIAGEPQLGSRGLYPTLNCHGKSGKMSRPESYPVMKILNLLSLADGNYTVEQLTTIMNMSAFDLLDLIDLLRSKQVLA